MERVEKWEPREEETRFSYRLVRSGKKCTEQKWEIGADLLQPDLSLLLLLGFHKGCGVKTGRTTT